MLLARSVRPGSSSRADGHLGRADSYVNCRNNDRAPLLFISGENDHLMPPKIQQPNAKHCKSNTVTDIIELSGRSHLMPAQQGWEEIADRALAGALDHT